NAIMVMAPFGSPIIVEVPAARTRILVAAGPHRIYSTGGCENIDHSPRSVAGLPNEQEHVMSRKSSRRRFLRTSALASTGVWLTSGYELGQAAQQGANNKLNIAIIGAGGQGGGNLNNVSSENIVALCDVDERRAAPAFNKFPQATKYNDYRVMLEKQKNID